MVNVGNSIALVEHIPLEQGLRRLTLDVTKEVIALVEHIPLEQGLRHPVALTLSERDAQPRRAYSIRTRIKTACRAEFASFALVLVEHIPLEQGLRQQQHCGRW